MQVTQPMMAGGNDCHGISFGGRLIGAFHVLELGLYFL